MRKITIGLLLMALVVMGFGIRVSVEAKGNTQGNDVSQYTSERLGISFDYPSNWQVVESGVTISIGLTADDSEFDPNSTLTTGNAMITVTIFDNIAALDVAFQTEEVINNNDPVVFLQNLAGGIAEAQAAIGADIEERFSVSSYKPTIIIENVRAHNVGSRDMAIADLIQLDNQGSAVLIQLPDDAYGMISGVALNDEFEIYRDALDIVAGSLSYEKLIVNSTDYPVITLSNMAELEAITAMQYYTGFGEADGDDTAMSSDGSQLAIPYLHRVVVYDLATREVDQIFADEAFFYNVAFSPDGKHLVAGKKDLETEEFSVVIWSLESGEIEQILTNLTSDPLHLQFVDSGNLLLLRTLNDNIFLYDTATWIIEKTIDDQVAIEKVTVSSDGRLLATIGIGKIQVWDIVEIPTFMWESEYDQRLGTEVNITFSPDNTQLLATYEANTDSSYDRHFDVFDSETGATIVEYTERSWALYVLDYSPDGQLVAAGNSSKNLEFINPMTGETVRNIEDEHNDSINFVSFTPDGRLVVTVDEDNIVQFWGVR